MEKPNWKIKYIFVCMLLFLAIAIYGATNPDISKKDSPEIKTPSIKIGELLIPVEIAETMFQRSKGLSGKTSLPEDSGMLFIFPIPDKYNFWMPDMNFPIDIIWINDGVVVDITKNVTNEFDKNNPTYYSPKSPAKYIVEVNAGFSDKRNIKIGDLFEIN